MKKLLVVPALLKAHVQSYTRKDGTFVAEHDDKRQASAPKKPAAGGYVAPKEGEVGHHEHTEYGTYFRKGDKVKDQSGKTYEVSEHRGASVRTVGGDMFHPTKLKHADAGPKLVLPKKKPAAKPTGSAAPAKTVNIGTAKYPMHAKTSEKLDAKHQDGSTHHVGGFKAPDYPDNGGGTTGDVMVHHNGLTYSHTGKKGKNMKTGEDSYEYSNKDDGDRRLWVSRSGHLQED